MDDAVQAGWKFSSAIESQHIQPDIHHGQGRHLHLQRNSERRFCQQPGKRNHHSSDMQGWTVSASGSFDGYGISNAVSHSASYSYMVKQKYGFWPGSGTLRLTYATGSNYILSISMWHYWQNNSSDCDLYNGTTKIMDIPTNSSWYNLIYYPDAVWTNVTFQVNCSSQLYTRRNEYIDDIVITYWN
jgi:hypothetical protein